jgi:hypothetical protein
MQLITNMRVLKCADQMSSSILAVFGEYLLQIGQGVVGVNDIIEIDNDMVVPGSCFDDFCDSIFPDLNDRYGDADYLTARAILTPLHTGVKFVNDHLYSIFPSTSENIYYSADSLPNDNDDMDNYPVEVLNSVEIGNMPPHKLRLKIGYPVILLQNLHARLM